MDLRKIAWVMLFIGAMIMGVTYFLYQNAKNSGPAAAQAAALQQTSGDPEASADSPAPQSSDDSAAPSAQDDGPAPGESPVGQTGANGDDSPAETQDGPEESGQGQGTRGARRIEEKKWDFKRAGSNEKRYIGSANPASPFLFQLETVNRGASIYTVKLSRHQSTIADSEFAAEHPEDYDQLWSEQEGLRGPYSLLNPVSDGKKTRLPFATKTLWFRGASLPVVQNWQFANMDRQDWVALPAKRNDQEQSQAYEFVIEREGQKILTLTKTYTVKAGEESFYVDLTIENHYRDDLEICIDQAGPTGIPKEHYKAGEDLRQVVYGNFDSDEKAVVVLRHPIKNAQSMTPGSDLGIGRSDAGDPTLWLAAANKYFASSLYIQPKQEQLHAAAARAGFYFGAAMENDVSRNYYTGVMIGRGETEKVTPVLTVKPGADQAVSVRLNVFSGPKKRSLLDDQDDHPLYARLNYVGLIDVSSGCICAFEQLAFVMMMLLDALSVVALGNYGLAIILLVFVVRLLLHPLSRKSQTSMAKMQKLKPQIEKIQEKYKDDKATQQKEMMKLYRQAGASPFLGCLPMLLQIPIWVALWTSVNVSVELRHAGLLPIWLNDLSTPDAVVTFGSTLFGYINSVNILPLLLAVAMYFQMKLSPQMAGASAAATPEQEAQQKMFRYLMPGMMLVIFYNQPSGLTLYIMASTFVGVIESRVIRKHIEQKEAREAATEVVVQGPGKAARGARPKKPKGPFWHKQG